MIQSSRLPSLFLSALFALPVVAEPLLPGTLWAAEEKKIEFPAASQRSVVKQRVGLTDVEVDYSRPNKNDREIFGGLVPYGKLWRTGANAVRSEERRVGKEWRRRWERDHYRTKTEKTDE